MRNIQISQSSSMPSYETCFFRSDDLKVYNTTPSGAEFLREQYN